MNHQRQNEGFNIFHLLTVILKYPDLWTIRLAYFGIILDHLIRSKNKNFLFLIWITSNLDSWK